MARGEKSTKRFDRRINIRVDAESWHKIMIAAQKEFLPASTWIRKIVMDKISRK